MNTTIKNGEMVKKSTQLHREVKEMVERNTERLFLPHNEKLKKLFVEDLITSLREWEEKDYSNDYHLFSEFCYDLVGMIEQGRTLNMYDEYGNRFEFIGNLTKPDWRGGLREVCIDYVIPEMGLEWLKKSKEFFQERVEYWEQFNPKEQGLYEVGFSVGLGYEEHWFINDLQFLYERLVVSINEKLTTKNRNMNTTIKNGELVKDSTQLQMEEIKQLINLFMKELEDENGLWLEKSKDEDEGMILWINGDEYDECEYHQLEHIWYCYNVYKTSPRLGLYEEELLERLKESMIKE